MPFQSSHEGTHDHQWNPDSMMTLLAAEATPARAAAAGRRIPNRTTVASQSSPSTAGVTALDALVWNES